MDDLDTRRFDINNNRYKEKEDGTYFAKSNWRSNPSTQKELEQQYFWFKQASEEYVGTNRHPDGCFKCPRCKLQHYTPDTFEFLCDPCSTIVADHPRATEAQRQGIKYWAEKSRAYWSVNSIPDPEIEARLAYRDAITRGDNA